MEPNWPGFSPKSPPEQPKIKKESDMALGPTSALRDLLVH